MTHENNKLTHQADRPKRVVISVAPEGRFHRFAREIGIFARRAHGRHPHVVSSGNEDSDYPYYEGWSRSKIQDTPYEMQNGNVMGKPAKDSNSITILMHSREGAPDYQGEEVRKFLQAVGELAVEELGYSSVYLRSIPGSHPD